MVAAAVSALGCDIPAVPEPILEDQNLLFAVLRVGSPTVEVILEEWPASGGSLAISGATVTVTGLGQATQLVEAAVDGVCQVTFDGDFVPGRSGCYTATLPQPVAPLEAYALEVQLPGGGVVTAQTTTPAPPDFRVPPDTVETSWSTTPDNLPIAVVPTEVLDAAGTTRIDVAFGVNVATSNILAADLDACEPDAYVDPFLSPSLLVSHDFYFWGLECSGEPAPWTVLDLRLHAAAYDANYASYLGAALEGNAFSGADGTFGLTGAVGVFGSTAITTAPLVLAFQPDPPLPARAGRFVSR